MRVIDILNRRKKLVEMHSTIDRDLHNRQFASLGLNVALTLCPVDSHQYHYRVTSIFECIPVIKRDSSEAM